jgi:hypothetical protein
LKGGSSMGLSFVLNGWLEIICGPSIIHRNARHEIRASHGLGRTFNMSLLHTGMIRRVTETFCFLLGLKQPQNCTLTCIDLIFQVRFLVALSLSWLSWSLVFIIFNHPDFSAQIMANSGSPKGQALFTFVVLCPLLS